MTHTHAVPIGSLIEGDATCPTGFLAASCACGIKDNGTPDLALIVCDAPGGAVAAAMLTTNKLLAAPLVVTRDALAATQGRARALLINSGNANAATGSDGLERARACVAAVARQFECDPTEVLVNSTGVIGVPLAHEHICAAIPALAGAVHAGDLTDAAVAIRTTDTTTKVASIVIQGKAGPVRITGIAKGSGMIHPNMATMIGVLLTDAAVDVTRLDRALHYAVDRSFHSITVDGDTSTNDAVFALASGRAGEVDDDRLTDAMTRVSFALAHMIVRDGEGASKFIAIDVEHAPSNEDARSIAQTIASSLLVRTAVCGGDPNWGRVLAAACRAGVDVDPDRMSVIADGVTLFEQGAPIVHDQATLAHVFRGPNVRIRVLVGSGSGAWSFATCDLTHGYIDINASYMT